MSKSRNRRSAWGRSWGKMSRGRSTKVRPPRSLIFEHLEERQMLSATPTSTETLVGPEAKQSNLDHTIDLAFQHAADLSRYSGIELEDATRWIIKTDGTINAANFFSETGLVLNSPFSPIANTFFALAGSNTSGQIISTLSSNAAVEYFYPEVSTDFGLDSLPNDPLVRDQWHLRATGQLLSQPDEINKYGVWGADVRAEEAWEITTGSGVIVGVVDDSLARAHQDIAPNYSAEHSFDYNQNDPFPDASGADIGHGTAVGGIIGAAGDNGEGLSGIAYDATLAGIRLIGDPFTLGATFTDEKTYQALTHHQDAIDIYNNSWGTNHRARTVVPNGPFHAQALIDSAFLGRGGLGTIQVASSGNQAEVFDSANHANFKNSPYVITVAGFGENDSSVTYAEGGPSVFVTAPTGNNPPGIGILTTDIPGEPGFNGTGTLDNDFLADLDYTTQMNGTSASSPATAGVVALIVGAARDNGIELTQRDVQHILALSARRISPDDPTWQTNFRPLFFDPQTNAEGFGVGATNPAVPGGGSAIPWKFDPDAGGIISDVDPQFARPTNSAGFYVQDGFNYGYGHGAVDAGFAVKLAQNWQSVGTTHITNVIVHEAQFAGPAGTIPPLEELFNGAVRIPGGLGGVAGFGAHWMEWLAPSDPRPDPPPPNTRGGNYEFQIPPNMNIEWVEVTLNFDALPSADSDKMRMTLVSPDGTHSELTNWVSGGAIGPLTDTDSLNFTFSTNRHWGERSEGSGRANPLTGDRIEPGMWALAIENWSGSEAHLASARFDFHGMMTPVDFFNNGGRISGSIGVDINEDADFNFDGVTAVEVPIMGDVDETLIISSLEPDFEPMAGLVTVYVDLDKDGVRDELEPYMVTGADGNFYFDLPWSQDVGGVMTTYDVRFELPDGMTNLGPDMYEFIVGPQIAGDPDSVISTHYDANFLLQPEPITFEGNVFADFDGDSVHDFGDTTIEEFRVFVDLNENGKLDFVDVNANLQFDNGIDIALEPMQITSADGAFSIEVNPTDNMITNPFGTDIFFNDRFLGTEYYTLMLDARDGWAPTGLDVSAEGFASPLLGGEQSPSLAFHRLFVEAGETMVDMDFGVMPDAGSISGFVFNDLNQDGVRGAGEGGLAGFTVVLDLDQSGGLSAGDRSIITGANGNYLFEELPAGTYDILIETLGPGFVLSDQTSPLGGFHDDRPLATGQALGNGLVDFGFFDPDSTGPAARDWGDLDSPYLTTSAAGGPSHGIVPGFFLGAGVTADADGQPDPGAVLDAMDDGVVFLDPIVAGATVDLNVTASTNLLFLQGWVDFNDDGDFADAGEHLTFLDATTGLPLPFSQQPRLETGLNELSIVVPDAVTAATLAARFRYSEGGGAVFNKPNGAAILGEVEDYVVPAVISTSFIEPVIGDYNQNDIVDEADYVIWQQTYGSTLDLRADGNADGVVDAVDYTIWRNNLGNSATASLVIAPPIESSSASLGLVSVADGELTSFQLETSSNSNSGLALVDNGSTSLAIDLAFGEAFEEEEEEEASLFDVLAGDEDDEALALALEDEFLAAG